MTHCTGFTICGVALALAASWLANLAPGGPTVTILDSRLHQDVVFAPIPEPEIVLLMATGLLGVGAGVRRKKLRA